METFTLPLALFDDKNFNKLSSSARDLLFRIYVRSFDCDTFTIKLDDPKYYGYTFGVPLNRKVQELIECKFLKIVGYIPVTRNRIFEFKYKIYD